LVEQPRILVGDKKISVVKQNTSVHITSGWRYNEVSQITWRWCSTYASSGWRSSTRYGCRRPFHDQSSSRNHFIDSCHDNQL